MIASRRDNLGCSHSIARRHRHEDHRHCAAGSVRPGQRRCARERRRREGVVRAGPFEALTPVDKHGCALGGSPPAPPVHVERPYSIIVLKAVASRTDAELKGSISRPDTHTSAQPRRPSTANRCECARQGVPKTCNARQSGAVLSAPWLLHLIGSSCLAKRRSCPPWRFPLSIDLSLRQSAHRKCRLLLDCTISANALIFSISCKIG